MINSKYKKFLPFFLLILILIFNLKIPYALTKYGSNQIASIKSVIEQFIKDDYYFNGGKNDFSTVGNEDLKKYLIARNDFKHFNNKENNSDYTYFNQRFTFDYKNISDVDNNTKKVIVKVRERFDYTTFENGKPETTKDAGGSNLYTIYVTDFGHNDWKVMSANIDIDVDPIDADCNVNKVLGYEKKKRSKKGEPVTLDDALDNIKNWKEKFAKDLNLESEPEVEKNSH